ncbi:cyclic nucleotide-binding domain-containing protein, partial [Myxococcota bacterium]|nr:cyclic nucleotide-binding domain-containing protein [Myxococcota bacterium]
FNPGFKDVATRLNALSLGNVQAAPAAANPAPAAHPASSTMDLTLGAPAAQAATTPTPASTPAPAPAPVAAPVAAQAPSAAAMVLDLGPGSESVGPQRVVGVDPDFEVLQKLPLFQELSLSELKIIRQSVERAQFAPGSYLIKQGKAGTALYIILKGKVAVTAQAPDGTETLLVTLGPGVHVGEMALIDDGPTSANVKAIEPVLAFKLSRQRFEETLHTHDRIALRFYRSFVGDLVKRLRETNKKLIAS